MKFFLDECVPDSVREMLVEQGHSAYRITDFLAEGSPDPLVARYTQDQEAVLVSHDRDFKEYSSRRMDGQQPRFPGLSVVHMQCLQPRIRDRMIACLSLIALEYQERQAMHDRRLIIEVKTDFLVVHR
jgi:predicted nuclease of predicted toxin-antitoxin system